MKICPPIVIVAVLSAPVFAATEKVTVPDPVPLAGLVIVTQEALLLFAAVQEQLPVVVTAMLKSVLAAAVKVLFVGLML